MNKKAFKVTVVHYFENIGLEGKRNMGNGPKNIQVREGGGGHWGLFFSNWCLFANFSHFKPPKTIKD